MKLYFYYYDGKLKSFLTNFRQQAKNPAKSKKVVLGFMCIYLFYALFMHKFNLDIWKFFMLLHRQYILLAKCLKKFKNWLSGV